MQKWRADTVEMVLHYKGEKDDGRQDERKAEDECTTTNRKEFDTSAPVATGDPFVVDNVTVPFVNRVCNTERGQEP